jgi:hypothetical protein
MHADCPTGLQILLQVAATLKRLYEFSLSGRPDIDYFEPIHSFSFLSIEQVSTQVF